MDAWAKIRSWSFDSVIGVGGISREPQEENIAWKLNWVGVDAQKLLVKEWWDDPVVYFEHYWFLGPEGPLLRDVAPHLAKRMYELGGRTVMTFTDDEQEDVDRLLDLASKVPPSPARILASRIQKARRKCSTSRSTRC